MSEIHIHFNASSMEQSRSGQITGGLSFQIGTTFYPDQHWNDFVVIVLHWWLNQIAEMFEGSNSLLLRFMDGPYAIALSRRGKESFAVDLHHNGEKIRLDADINEAALAESALIASEHVLKFCRTRDWSSPDIDALQDAFDRAQETASRKRSPQDAS